MSKCICKTLKGVRCKNSVVAGTETCSRHVGKCDKSDVVTERVKKVVKKPAVKAVAKITKKAKVVKKTVSSKKVTKTIKVSKVRKIKESPDRWSNLELLPCDILLQIANKLPPKDYGKLALSSKKLKQCLKEGRAGETTNKGLLELKRSEFKKERFPNIIHVVPDLTEAIGNYYIQKLVKDGFIEFGILDFPLPYNKPLFVVRLEKVDNDVNAKIFFRHPYNVFKNEDPLFEYDDIDQIWTGSGTYGNTMLLVRRRTCIYIGEEISKFKLKKGEYITNFRNFKGINDKIRGHIQTNLGYYGFKNWTGQTGFIPLKQMGKRDLSYWTITHPFVPIDSYKVITKK